MENIKRGTKMVDIYGGPDYGFVFLRQYSEGMIELQNRSGVICVAASEWKVAA